MYFVPSWVCRARPAAGYCVWKSAKSTSGHALPCWSCQRFKGTEPVDKPTDTERQVLVRDQCATNAGASNEAFPAIRHPGRWVGRGLMGVMLMKSSWNKSG